MDKRHLKEKLEMFKGELDRISITRVDGEMLFDIIKEHDFKNTLETGLGYGVSSLYIMGATGAEHIVMDPFEHSYCKSLGLSNLKKAGYINKLKFFPQFSHIVLPELLKEGKEFDFIFLDGSHLFDGVFLDFYYSELLLKYLPAVKKIMRWIHENKGNFEDISPPDMNLSVFRKNQVMGRVWNHYVEF